MYIVRYSKVVSSGCNHAALVCYTFDWTVGSLSASSTCFSFRDYFPEACLCVCATGYSLLVRGFDASAFHVACEEKC